MATAEAALRAGILRAIRQRYTRRQGVIVFGRPASAATGPGHPDLFGVVRGFFMALEIKTRTGKPTPLQVQRIQELREAGAYAWVVRSPAQALSALAHILEGGRAPMSNEPIDLNDWLNSAPLTETEQGAAQAVASVTDADVDAAQAKFDAAAEVGTDDLLATFPAALTAPVDNGTVDYTPEPLPDFESVEQPAPEVSREEKLQSLDARDEALDSAYTAEHREAAASALGFDSAAQRMLVETNANVKAVGDRVTLVFESINRLETDVAAFGKMFRALLKALEVEESELPEIPPADPKRARRKKAE